MAAKGQFKDPLEPLGEALERAMAKIDECKGPIAIFMIGGRVSATRADSHSYEANLKRLANNLVGVYDLGADARQVRADLAEFYPEAA